jgi:LysM repeat protein
MPWKLFFVGVLLGSLAFQTFTTSAAPTAAMPVAFLSQFDGSPYAATDCGPASVAMAINYATGKKLKPLEVRQAITRLPGGGYAANTNSGTAIGDLARIAKIHGVETFAGDGAASVGWGPERIRKHLGEGHTVIVLARLAYLPGYKPTSQIDHYIVLIGATQTGYLYNDPGLSNGAQRTIGERQLQLAQRSSSVPGQGLALAGPGGGGAKAAVVETAKEKPKVSVTVAKGDTVSQIAQRFGIAQKEIVTLNGLRNVNHIEVGQVLALPESAQARLDKEAEATAAEAKVAEQKAAEAKAAEQKAAEAKAAAKPEPKGTGIKRLQPRSE